MLKAVCMVKYLELMMDSHLVQKTAHFVEIVLEGWEGMVGYVVEKAFM